MTIEALRAFSADNTLLLVVSDTGELSAVDRATQSCWTLFLARLGFGSAALCNVHRIITQNDDAASLNVQTHGALAALNEKIERHNERCWVRSNTLDHFVICNPEKYSNSWGYPPPVFN